MGARTRGLANNVLTGGKIDATDGVSGVIDEANIANSSLTSATTYGSVTGGVPQVSSDPPSPTLADAWYNTTAGKLKFRADVAAWSSGGNSNTARSDLAGLGIQTSAMKVGGYANPGTQSVVENYDGSSWSEIAELNTSRNSMGGFGATNTAAIACGGRSPTTGKTESYNGSSWTEVNDMNTARFAMNISGCGTQTTGLTSAGQDSDTVETWDGTNWTAAGAELNTARSQGSQSGATGSAAIVSGGAPGYKGNTEIWNGSTWTEVADMNTARYSQAQSGIPTGALIHGGEVPGGQTNITELWDGTSWAETNDLSTTRKDHGAGGHSANTASIAFGGKAPPTSFKNATEEWNIAEANTIVG